MITAAELLGQKVKRKAVGVVVINAGILSADDLRLAARRKRDRERKRRMYADPATRAVMLQQRREWKKANPDKVRQYRKNARAKGTTP